MEFFCFGIKIEGIEKEVAKSRDDDNRPRRRLKQSGGLFYRRGSPIPAVSSSNVSVRTFYRTDDIKINQ